MANKRLGPIYQPMKMIGKKEQPFYILLGVQVNPKEPSFLAKRLFKTG